ncbi:MAG: radical SAM protein [Planctomycetes bacterium]|nr:radical SAM protein [Planctomycetota bacterium]
MRLTGVHLLLTYTCNLECEHCFVWSSPWQPGTMTVDGLDEIIRQSADLGSVEWLYFEGGEPFLLYPILLRGVREAAARGFKVGIVSNGYWATTARDGIEWLRPMQGLVHHLSVSRDSYHGRGQFCEQADNACAAADELGIPTGTIAIAAPETTSAGRAMGQLPNGESAVVYRGRAAVKLSPRAGERPLATFTECPCEDLREPGRVHVDPFGNVHICQGISLGNVFETPLARICAEYDPDAHPIVGPILRGGPAELIREHDVPHREFYGDACHACYEARVALRERYSAVLVPDQMYGVVEA